MVENPYKKLPFGRYQKLMMTNECGTETEVTFICQDEAWILIMPSYLFEEEHREVLNKLTIKELMIETYKNESEFLGRLPVKMIMIMKTYLGLMDYEEREVVCLERIKK